MKKSIILLAMAIVVAATACRQTTQTATVAENETGLAWYEDTAALNRQLAAAVLDAKQLDSAKIATNLMPIRKDYPGQEWTVADGHDMVLVVTLVDSSRMERFFGRDDVYQIEREMGTWVSLPADWKNHAAAFEGLDSVATHMRMLQLFGLSPDCDYDIMVQFYADPTTIFRPSHDPDITTTTTTLDFPAKITEDYKVGETNFREWYRYSVQAAYEDDSPLPWTQMGYTYDWHEGAPHQGLSEYIVGHHTWIKVKTRQKVSEFISGLLK